MDSSRTTTSGEGLTLITGPGGRPMDRGEVEAWCVMRAGVGTAAAPPATRPRVAAGDLISV